MFQLVACNVAVLAIAGLYFSWKERTCRTARGRARLRERVAYLLWVAAHRG